MYLIKIGIILFYVAMLIHELNRWHKANAQCFNGSSSLCKRFQIKAQEKFQEWLAKKQISTQVERQKLDSMELEKDQKELEKKQRADTAFETWKQNHQPSSSKHEPSSECILNGVATRKYNTHPNTYSNFPTDFYTKRPGKVAA